MSVIPQTILAQQSQPSPLVAPAIAPESARNAKRASVQGSFANFLDESRQQMRAKLQQRENISPQQMFEKPTEVASRNPDSIKKNGDQPSSNANENEAASQNTQRFVNDRSRVDLQSKEPRSNFFDSNASRSAAIDLGQAPGKDAQNHLDEINSSRAAIENTQTRSKQSSSRDSILDGSNDLRYTTSASSGGTQSTNALSSDAAKTPTSGTTNLAEDLGQWLKSQMKQEVSGVSADKLIIASPTRSSSNPLGEATKSAAPETQHAQLQVDEEHELESSSRAIFNQLVRSMRVRHDAQSSSAQIELDPPRLGPMRVDIRMEGDQLRMEVQTTNEEAKELLTSKLADLKTALHNQGIKLDDVSVLVTKSITPLDESIATQNQRQISLSRNSTNQSASNRTDSKYSTKRHARNASDGASHDAHELFATAN